MTIRELLNRIYFEAQLQDKVKNKTEFAEKLGVTLDTASKGLRGLDGFATQSLANRARAAFPDIAAQVESRETSGATVVNIGSTVGNHVSHVNSHNTGTSARMQQLEVENATLKAENEHLKEMVAEKERTIKVYEILVGKGGN